MSLKPYHFVAALIFLSGNIALSSGSPTDNKHGDVHSLPVRIPEGFEIPEVYEDKEWCDDVLGCLYITDDWYTSGRPINVLPDTRAKINTRFYLHTREARNVDINYIISADDLSTFDGSTFDPTKPTKFIVHGFTNNGDTKWLGELAQNLLDYGDYNVFRTDWGGGSMPMYYQATANTRVVGLEIGHLVNTMVEAYGVNVADVHLIGHSLGSHVSGYAGEQIPNLGRITGLDPAGPYFTGTPYFVHLDPTDAVYVDNIHTDADSIFVLGYGTAQPMGNVDFFPNSGHDQPGCDPANIAIELITEGMIENGGDIVACSHLRSIDLFQETLVNKDCTMMAHECYDYNSFEDGNCYSCSADNSKCSYFGIRADEYTYKNRQFVEMYLDTDKNSPYCYEHYDVRILTAHPKEAESWVMGNIKITLYGDTSAIISDEQITEDHERIDHGVIKTNLFTSHENEGHILRIELHWNYNDKILNPGTYCGLFCNKSLYVQSVEVSPINHYPESSRLGYTVLACSNDGSTTEIADGKTVSFLPNGNCQTLDGH